jgi:hypothetical protein
MSTPTGNLAYYAIPNYWVDGYTIDEPVASPQTQLPVTVQTVIPSYLYWQYADDSNLQAFVASYNTQAQMFVNTFNALNMPVYTGSFITGALLDWVANGIYGIYRPVLQSGSLKSVGTYESVAPYMTAVPYEKITVSGTVTEITTSDDIFKRIMTWNLYRGDGKIFSTMWLKRRVLRFLNGINGTDPGIDQTYLVSVTFSSGNQININLAAYVTANPASPVPNILQDAISAGVLNLPFMYSYVVNV